MTLKDALDAIKSQKLDLRPNQEDSIDNDIHRPQLRVSAIEDDTETKAHVALIVSAAWGQPIRFVSLTPSEARQLARNLTSVADAADAVIAGMPE